jgi:hypothetical protein
MNVLTLCAVLALAWLVLIRPGGATAPGVIRASGSPQVQESPPESCCLIPANRGLYRVQP